MAQNSKIEWTHHTANLWHGCTKVHEGCDNCYAETLSKRWGNDIWGNDKPRKEIKSVWNDLAKYQKLAAEAGEMHRVFVGSMMDIFEKPMPLIDSKGVEQTISTGYLRHEFFKRIDEGDYPNLMFLLLTKRASNINKYIPDSWKERPPSNVMFGTSPVNQETFHKLVGQLCEVNGNKFLSVEPQLDFIDITTENCMWGKVYGDTSKGRGIGGQTITSDPSPINWIIQGGESGHHKRPFNLEWAYRLKEQCEILNIPYFFKQIDKVQPIPEDLLVREFPKTKEELV